MTVDNDELVKFISSLRWEQRGSFPVCSPDSIPLSSTQSVIPSNAGGKVRLKHWIRKARWPGKCTGISVGWKSALFAVFAKHGSRLLYRWTELCKRTFNLGNTHKFAVDSSPAICLVFHRNAREGYPSKLLNSPVALQRSDGLMVQRVRLWTEERTELLL